MRWGRLLTTYIVRQISQCRWASTITASHSEAHHSIPGPTCYPIVGSLLDMITDKDFNKEQHHHYPMKLFKKYGPIVKVKYPGHPPIVMLLKPADCQEILRRTTQNPVRPPIGSLKEVRYNNPHYNKKAGITSENGDEWARVRSKVQVPLLKQKFLNVYMEDFDQISLEFLDRISGLRDSNGQISVNFSEELRKWSLEHVCLISLNQRVRCFDSTITQDFETDLIIKTVIDFLEAITECETGSQLWKFYPTKMYKQLEKSMAILYKTCERVVMEVESKIEDMKRRNEELTKEKTAMEYLLTETSLTRTDIITFLMDLMPSGTDTTSENVGVFLYLLAKNPAAQKKIQEEVDQVLGDGNSYITPHQMAKLTYTKAAFKEANRLMPPLVGPVRLLQEDVHIGGYTFKKGWLVHLMSALNAWSEEEYSRPLEFLPERWLRHHPFGPIHPCASLPFSYGSRLCAGKRLAEQEIFIFVARTLQRFNLDWKHGELERTHKFVFSTKGPLKFTFIDR